MDKILQKCSTTTGYDRKIVEDVIHQFLNGIADELAQGNAVDLGEDFGKFSVRLRTGNMHENSPRTPKDSHYKVIFRENRCMRRRLKVAETPKEL